MTNPTQDQWLRKVGLILFTGDKGLDLSALRIRFETQNADVESPNSAAIRVYNVSGKTISSVVTRGEFDQVVLNAGYQKGNYGVIFQGSIKQFRVGRENATDTYLDILASDGDIGYNQGFVNASLDKSATNVDRINEAIKAMPSTQPGFMPDFGDSQHVPNLRGKVMFGMARTQLRNSINTMGASWSIQNGKVNIIMDRGYLPGQEVKINRLTGMVGIPEQTDGGIKVRCLLNSKLKIGGLIQLDNNDITQTMFSKTTDAPISYNSWTAFHHNTALSKDGTYRIYVAEHEGDNRGQAWYTTLTCLAIDTSAPANQAVLAGN